MANKGIVLRTNYTFSAYNKTIIFSSDYLGMSLSDITYITNIKSGIATVIYDPFDITKGGVLNGLTLTLAYNTATMEDTDPLQIIVGFTPISNNPLLVQVVDTPSQLNNVDIFNNISNAIDQLVLSQNIAEGLPIHTKDVGLKKDSQSALILSDAPDDIKRGLVKAINETYVVDNTGYNTVIFNVIVSQQAQFTVESSIDGFTWIYVAYTLGLTTAVTFNNAGVTSLISGNNAVGVVSCNTVGKLTRIRIIGISGGAATIVGLLRNTVYGANHPSGTQINIGSFAGNTPFVYGGNSAVSGASASTTGLTVGSPWPVTTNTPAQASTLATTVPFPFGIAGREQPYPGAISGIFRYINVDGGGRSILGGDISDTATPYQSKKADGTIPSIAPRGVGGIPNNMIGAQNLTVADISQTDGDTHTMLLKQILIELKINNQQLVELATALNTGLISLSDPQEYRNDITFQ